jgi:predicted ATP-grasp superfamily ATP-dependent carboligase
LERRLAKYKADPEAAKKLLSVGERKLSPNVDVSELAAYTLTANVILNLDETVTKE